MNAQPNNLSNPADEASCAAGDTPDLWQRYRRCADSELEGSLIEQYLPLVRMTVCRLLMTLPAHVSADDLHSAGLVGLLQSVRNYDPSCRCSFETYARQRIRGAVLDELRRMDWAPRSVHERARKLEQVMFDLGQRLGRMPDEAEMAAALGLTVADYQRCLDEIRPATFVCLDSVAAGDGEEACLYEVISDPTQDDPAEHAVRLDLAREIADCIRSLPETKRKVLALYYYEDLQLKEIAVVLGLSESRICQLHAQAILTIRVQLQMGDVLRGNSRRLQP